MVQTYNVNSKKAFFTYLSPAEFIGRISKNINKQVI